VSLALRDIALSSVVSGQVASSGDVDGQRGCRDRTRIVRLPDDVCLVGRRTTERSSPWSLLNT
jgi:hypothetical protein